MLAWLGWLALWFLLTGDVGASSVLLGLPICVAVAALSAAGRTRPRWHRLPGLAGFFVLESLRGGIDVARRALLPGCRLQPALLRYRVALPAGAPRVWLAVLASLIPGTLSVRYRGETLVLHVLDRGLPVVAAMRALELRVGRLSAPGAAP